MANVSKTRTAVRAGCAFSRRGRPGPAVALGVWHHQRMGNAPGLAAEPARRFAGREVFRSQSLVLGGGPPAPHPYLDDDHDRPGACAVCGFAADAPLHDPCGEQNGEITLEGGHWRIDAAARIAAPGSDCKR